MSNRTYACEKPNCFACQELNRVDKTRKNGWSNWELAYLENNYKVKRTEWISKVLNRSITSIWQKIHEIKAA